MPPRIEALRPTHPSDTKKRIFQKYISQNHQIYTTSQNDGKKLEKTKFLPKDTISISRYSDSVTLKSPLTRNALINL